MGGWNYFVGHTRFFPDADTQAKRLQQQFGLVDYLKELLCDTTMCWGRVSSKAAKGGQLEVLKWQLGLGLKFSTKPLCKAVLQAHLEIAKWLATIISPDNSLAWSTMAASRSQLEMLKWLVTQKWAWPYRNEWTCVAAAQGGHLETLKWLKKRDGRLNEWVCWTAARNGHLEVLKWALANGASWDLQSCTSEYFNCLKRIGVGKESIAQSGHLDVLKFAIDCGGVFHPKTCEDAARGGYLDILKWARENGCSWDEATCAAAALGGHLEILKWARENGAPWDYRTLSKAASKCTMEVLEWVLLNGHWNTADFEVACTAGGFSIFIWLLERQDFGPQVRLCSQRKIASLAVRQRSACPL